MTKKETTSKPKYTIGDRVTVGREIPTGGPDATGTIKDCIEEPVGGGTPLYLIRLEPTGLPVWFPEGRLTPCEGE